MISGVEIKTQEIAQVADYLKDLVAKLEPKICAGEYDLLVVEGVSARIPGTVVHRLINESYRALGRDEVVPIYLGRDKNGNHSLGVDELEEKYGKARLPENAHALILSEIIYRGEKIGRLGQFLESRGVTYDAAVVQSAYDEAEYRRWGYVSERAGYYSGWQYPRSTVDWADFNDRAVYSPLYKQDWMNIGVWNLLMSAGEESVLDPRILSVKQDLKTLQDWIWRGLEFQRAIHALASV